MSDAARMESFIGLSQALTGISRSVLAPDLDPIDLKSTYLQTLDQQIGPPATDALLQLYVDLKQQGLSDEQIAQTILEPPLPPPPAGIDPVAQAAQARSIMKMWLLGSWYMPTLPGQAEDLSGTVISANAYTGGLAWTIAQAHPMGYSELSFGYWATPSPPLPDGIPVQQTPPPQVVVPSAQTQPSAGGDHA
ncbi:MAG TPA: sorbitol dehydrogenase [Thermoanaerobaculia bacterium]|nr:sorbitol dehydrogenase [Thermoanaerobaculia bacterium]